MNFSLSLKEELIAGAPHAACCRRSYLRGLFFDAAQTRDKAVVLHIGALCAREEAARIYRELYKKEALSSKYDLLFSCDALYQLLTSGTPLFGCPHCAEHFFRGLLIACGSVTDPAKGYLTEINLKDGENLPFLIDFLTGKGWKPSLRRRGDTVCLYYKNSTVIEEILTFLGANFSLFTLMNEKIAHTIRNDENRATNCVTQNIVRSVSAAGKLLAAIEKLHADAAFEKMSAELQETANLRAENPDASLTELAALHNPPITKSGLHHRLQKIMEFAEK